MTNPQHASPGRRPVPVQLLVVVVLAEAVLMAGVTAVLVLDLVAGRASSIAAAVFLVLCAAGAAVLLVAIARGIRAGQPWTRAATFTWQLVQLAIAVGSFGGQEARPGVGWALLVPTLLALVLLFTPTVMNATRAS